MQEARLETTGELRREGFRKGVSSELRSEWEVFRSKIVKTAQKGEHAPMMRMGVSERMPTRPINSGSSRSKKR